MTAPPKCLIRWGELVTWCAGEGIGQWTLKRWLREGRIRRLQVPGGTRAYYSVSEVYRLLHGGNDLPAVKCCCRPKL